MILIELTSPNDENLEYWRNKKRDRYAEFKTNIAVEWQCHMFSLEVSSRGYVLASSFFELTNALGIQGAKKKKLRDELSKTALRCSYVIFINRFNELMNKQPITPCDIPANILLSKVVRNVALENTIMPTRTPVCDQKTSVVEQKDITCEASDNHTVIELKASRLPSKEFVQFQSIDPSHALLYIKYGDKYLALLQNPKWFGEAMLKLSRRNVEVLDPAGALISLRYTKNMGSVLSNPDWFGDAMVKLSSPTVSIVQELFPLPPKVQ